MSSPSTRRVSMPATPTFRGSSTFADKMRNFANLSKPAVEVVLNGQEGLASPPVCCFTTFDAIEGNVHVTAPTDTKFDAVDIIFVGTTKTFVEKMGSVSAINGRTEAFHQFLRLQQPVFNSQYPPSRTLEAGKTYSFPFTFVLPNQMLPSSCKHKTSSAKLKDAHMQLPPSLGDADMTGGASAHPNDMSPDMARVTYRIKVRVIRSRERDSRELTVADKSKQVLVVPSAEEMPPVDIDGQDDEYCLRKEKSIRKGLFKSKSGRLVVEAAQPRSLRLPAPNAPSDTNVATVAKVTVRFEAGDANARPPRFGTLTSKLKAVTFYASTPQRRHPAKVNLIYDQTQGVIIESVNLSSRDMQAAEWARHEPGDSPGASRRDSAVSTHTLNGSFPEATSSFDSSKPFYTTTLVVPVTLPKTKRFVPTFHSCLVSRIYILDISIALPDAGPASSVSLKIPLQISAEGNPDNEMAHGSLAEMDADDPLNPRTIAPPQDEYLETSAIGQRGDAGRASVSSAADASVPPAANAGDGPPEYSYFPRRSASMPICA